MIHSYPKVYNLGHAAIADLLLDDVLVEEKVDGSQFSFGLFDGEFQCRSKGKSQNPGETDKMFEVAVEQAMSRVNLLAPDWTYRAEFLSKPKHNTLAYDRVPDGNFILFDVDTGDQSYIEWEQKVSEAERLGLDVVPRLLEGKLESFDQFEALMDTLSVLGGSKVEGVVIKNYHRFGRDGKCLMGKFVSEKFKEVHGKDWKVRNPGGKDIKQLLGAKLHSEARWHKAIQHLRENGELTDSPKDIGPLMKEVSRDVIEECGDQIRDALFKWAWKDISRSVTRGLPEWYKELLAKAQFGE